MNGIVGTAIAHAVRDKGYVHLDDELQRASYADQLEAGLAWVAANPEDEIIRRESGAPVRDTSMIGTLDKPHDHQARACVM